MPLCASDGIAASAARRFAATFGRSTSASTASCRRLRRGDASKRLKDPLAESTATGARDGDVQVRQERTRATYTLAPANEMQRTNGRRVEANGVGGVGGGGVGGGGVGGGVNGVTGHAVDGATAVFTPPPTPPFRFRKRP